MDRQMLIQYIIERLHHADREVLTMIYTILLYR